VVEVDRERKTVRVQAGVRVQQLVDAIKEDGLTLQNFASIFNLNAILPLCSFYQQVYSVIWIFIFVTLASKIKQERNFKQLQLNQGL